MFWMGLTLGFVAGVACIMGVAFYLRHLSLKNSHAGSDTTSLLRKQLDDTRRYLLVILSSGSLEHAIKVARKALKETE